MPIRVLVVEDSTVARKLIVAILNADEHIEVVGEAIDGLEGVEKAASLKPDVITMDVRMPRMDGLQATREIMANTPTPVVVISATDPKDVEVSFAVMSAGALTLLAKPVGPTNPDFPRQAGEIRRTVRVMSGVRVRQRAARDVSTPPAVAPRRPQAARPAASATQPPAAAPQRPTFSTAAGKVKLALIGASTGGPQALETVLCGLSASFPVPIVIVQHISPGFEVGMAQWLDGRCQLSVSVAEDGQMPRPGDVLIAPSGFHTGVTPEGTIALLNSGPIGGHQPAVDHLFRSGAALGSKAVGVILTGMGRDGAEGLLEMRRAGAHTIGQDEATCVVYGMPREADRCGAVTQISPLGDVAAALAYTAR